MTNAERDRIIMEKLNEGVSLSDVQQLLASQYGVRMTYFELRLLAAGLQVDWERQDKHPAAQPAPEPMATEPEKHENTENLQAEEEQTPAEDDEPDNAAPEDEKTQGGDTQVELDEPPMAGTAMSGSVTFASGASGKWALTRDGRFGFEPDEGSAEPTEEDYALFQTELRKKMMGEDEPEDPNAGPTLVDVDAVVRPGVRVSGTVTFSSGASGRWMLDMRGQLDFELDEGSSKPTRRDAVKFQQELRRVLSKKGY